MTPFDRAPFIVIWKTNVCPSGVLPMPVANVRHADVVEVYREDPLFRSLRTRPGWAVQTVRVPRARPRTHSRSGMLRARRVKVP